MESLSRLKALYKQPFPDLVSLADKARQEYYGPSVTYSRNYTIPISNYCRNNCDYCAFRPRPPDVPPKIYTPEEIRAQLAHARQQDCSEILFLTGEAGSQNEAVQHFLEGTPWHLVEDYYLWALQEAVSMGLLPHSNFGIVEREWLAKFKPWNASMGLMLETTSPALCETGRPHQFSPGKDPVLRMQFLRWAGELRIPFTTGLLIGIGESVVDRLESLLAIRGLADQFGHIQEVILQNFLPNPVTPLWHRPPPKREEMLRLVAVARILFQGKISVQVPPNLNPEGIFEFIRAGANDLGGISPATIDYVNPGAVWPGIQQLIEVTTPAGITLRPRLPVYDSFLSDKFLSPAILRNITAIQKKIHDGG